MLEIPECSVWPSTQGFPPAPSSFHLLHKATETPVPSLEPYDREEGTRLAWACIPGTPCNSI